MSITTGQFLKEKVQNMHAWLETEGCKLPDAPDTPLKCTIFAQLLHDNCADVIERRSFDELHGHAENLPADIVHTLRFIRERPELHDKFWRYLELFSTTVS